MVILKIFAGIIAVVGGLLLKDGYPAWKAAGYGVPPDPVIEGAIFCLIGIVLPIVLDWRKSVKDRKERYLLKKNQCIDALRQLVHKLGARFKNEPAVRSNIMLIDRKTSMTAVHTESAFNMATDTDSDLAFAQTAGVAGEAFNRKKWIFGDLTIEPVNGQAHWNSSLTDAQRAKVKKGLNGILSVPIFDPDKQEADGLPPLLGTLQVDTIGKNIVVFHDTERAAAMASSYADAIAVLLRAGGIA